eukprot:2727247-Amphidinium_carterae.1
MFLNTICNHSCARCNGVKWKKVRKPKTLGGRVLQFVQHGLSLVFIRACALLTSQYCSSSFLLPRQDHPIIPA